MVSFSAFRSFFVARESRRREDRNRHLHWYMSRKNQAAAVARRWMKLRSDESEEMNGLPEIPRATITGMDTFIRGEGTEANYNCVISECWSHYKRDTTNVNKQK